MEATFERRVAPAGRLAATLAWPLRLSRKQAWQVIVIGGGIVAIADRLSGPEVWFGPAYLMIIGVAAWCLGWKPAVVVGSINMALTLVINDFELYPYSGIASAWNIAMRVVAVLMVIGMLHTARAMYAREWRLSRTDPLTGALNRKAFYEMTSGRTHSRSWSLLVYADLDGFKKLNDSLGHAAGDECLMRFVREVATVIRGGDVFARLGGDEFALYLDVKDAAAAAAVAVRLHAAMNAVELGSGAAVRCSVGALTLEPGPRSIDREIRSADELMYQAKCRGSSLVVGTAARDRNAQPNRHDNYTPAAGQARQSPTAWPMAGSQVDRAELRPKLPEAV
jgi:diguanylate cyclase (GGDEF)-like protein